MAFWRSLDDGFGEVVVWEEMRSENKDASYEWKVRIVDISHYRMYSPPFPIIERTITDVGLVESMDAVRSRPKGYPRTN